MGTGAGATNVTSARPDGEVHAHATMGTVRRLLIIRHGESEWNREGRWQGWVDIALTPAGEAQARARGADLHASGLRFAAVHTSDLVRATRTAELLAEALGIVATEPHAALRERFGGEWQGHTWEEIVERWPEERAAWRRGELAAPPGGETETQVVDRVFGALAEIDTVNAAGPLLVVTHGGVVRLLSHRAGAPITELTPNLGGRWFDWDGTALHASEALPAIAPVPNLHSE
jgi:glucosyl-3-phosphoglycerate phosphatase